MKPILSLMDVTIIWRRINMNNLKKRYITIAIYLNIGSLLFTGCINNQPHSIASHTKVDSTWQEFSKSYKSSDYNMRKEIDYFELRKYIVEVKSGKLMTPKYIPYLSIYRKPLSSYSSKIRSQFRKLAFDTTQKISIETTSTHNPKYKFKTKGFMIKNDKTFMKINEKKDFIWLFDGIDTPAELYQFLKINKLLKKRNSYKKTVNGFSVKIVDIIYKTDTKRKGDMDEWTSYELHTTYIYDIKPNGKFHKKLISSKKKNIRKSMVGVGFHGDPEILVPLGLSTILSDTRLVTP